MTPDMFRPPPGAGEPTDVSKAELYRALIADDAEYLAVAAVKTMRCFNPECERTADVDVLAVFKLTPEGPGNLGLLAVCSEHTPAGLEAPWVNREVFPQIAHPNQLFVRLPSATNEALYGPNGGNQQ